MVLQILFSIFVLFVLSRIVLRWREGIISLGEFFFWLFVWIVIGLVVLLPQSSAFLARLLGVGRGADAIVYISIILIFYAIFRIVVKLEFIEHEITLIVRENALKDGGADQKPQPPNANAAVDSTHPSHT